MDERGIVSKSKLTALALKIKAAAGESGSFTLDELAALDISGGGGETITLSATFDAGENKIFTTDALDDLKQYLTVVVTVAGQAVEAFPLSGDAYTLSGTLAAGSNTITVTFLNKTATFTVSGVIAATDVTPAFTASGWVVGAVNTTVLDYIESASALSVHNDSNQTYAQGIYRLTIESGFRYRLSVDIENLRSTSLPCIGLVNNSTYTPMMFSTAGEVGHVVVDGLPSSSSAFNTDARIVCYITRGTATKGNCTFKNIKLIKYAAS